MSKNLNKLGAPFIRLRRNIDLAIIWGVLIAPNPKSRNRTAGSQTVIPRMWGNRKTRRMLVKNPELFNELKEKLKKEQQAHA